LRYLPNKVFTASLIYGVGNSVADMVQGNAPTTMSSKETKKQMVQTVGGDMLHGATDGAIVGSILPGVATALGGGIGAVAGGLYAERHQITHAISAGWHDLFGGGNSSQPNHANSEVSGYHAGGLNLATTIPIIVNFPDGSQTIKTVTKQTKATAARS
jgi:hypothetical protein